MFDLTRAQFLLIVALTLLAGSAKSAPVITTTSTTVTTQSAPTTTVRLPAAQPETRWNHADYVLSETEYQQLLDRLQREAEESVLANPGNYVGRDVDIEEINRLIELAETSTQPSHNQVLSSTGSPGTTLQTTGSLETSSTNPVNLGAPDLTSANSDNSTTTTTTTTTTTQSTRECPICLETIEPGDYRNIVELKCRHQFHLTCITNWAQYSGRGAPRCPICRGVMVTNDNELIQ